MPRIGPTELIIILVIILIIFGAGKLPEIGGAIGKGIRNFRRSASGSAEAEEDDDKEKAKDAEETAKKKSKDTKA
ncbi:MAG: twin-arginine translocase TatA/TatE family subunit [Chloroflexi bacterium]|nr:twin-arginine translocase TatA/TatE family subunit [Chloroflexota bacterium]